MAEGLVELQLSSRDLGQISDCLELRLLQWENTIRYFEAAEPIEGEILECSDIEEAREMTGVYRRLVRLVGEALCGQVE